ncbi:phosphatase PAP2 family protein [Stenotrophomonas sp. PD6]|uniref:phosphatase PAP2 family protein n=1 Tax=Stenotrophomonas sp. PD6 TaxID=3368612 RepID=UPI003B9FB28C
MSNEFGSTLAVTRDTHRTVVRPNPMTHVVIPLVAVLVASFVLMQHYGDLQVSAWLYAAQGHSWALKDAWITEQVIHKLGRNLSVGAGLVVLGLAIASAWKPSLAGLRRPLLRLFVSVALSTILVSLLKKHTGMDCPWDLTRFGGSREYYGLFDARPAGVRASGCFPAGHASAGYAWLALYFFALEVWPRWRYPALGLAAAMGMLFGISQQLRGAHFMSHDVWTAAICWFTALALFVLWPPKKTADAARGRSGAAD